MVVVTTSGLHRWKSHRERGNLGPWGAVFACLIIFYVLFFRSSSLSTGMLQPSHGSNSTRTGKQTNQGMKVLYILTSSKEFNTGERETKQGQDRFMEILFPVVLEGVKTMVPTYEVDVYLVLGYHLSQERQAYLQHQLPVGVGLQVWNDATPLNYEFKDSTTRALWVDEMPMSLARQHRYVIKDKLPYYDFFLAFEDDMLITKSHIDYYLSFSNDIRNFSPRPNDSSSSSASSQWWGPMTDTQISRIRPGFIRNEVLTSSDRSTQEDPGPIRPSLRSAGNMVDPSACCHHSEYVGLQGQLAPLSPTAEQLVIWETAIQGLSVRRLPDDHRWVALLPILGAPDIVEGYWSGKNDALLPEYPKKPKSSLNEYMAQSAGWMATQQELLEWHTKTCRSSFLPPFDPPYYQDDGMGFKTESVEYWSGGLQLFGQMCGIQRLLSLDPAEFSKHLIYHTANNKQKEIPRNRLVLVTTLAGQLRQVQMAAQNAMYRKLRKASFLYPFFRILNLAD